MRLWLVHSWVSAKASSLKSREQRSRESTVPQMKRYGQGSGLCSNDDSVLEGPSYLIANDKLKSNLLN